MICCRTSRLSLGFCQMLVLMNFCLLLASCASEEDARITRYEAMLDNYRNPELHVTSYETGREVARQVLHGRQTGDLSVGELVLLSKAYNYAGEYQQQLQISELILVRNPRHSDALSSKENALLQLSGNVAGAMLAAVTNKYPFGVEVELPGFVPATTDDLFDFSVRLSQTLESQGLGKTLSGGAMIDSQSGASTGWCEQVYVADVERALPVMRKYLVGQKVPRGACIMQYAPSEIRWPVYEVTEGAK
jgi:hypothetical protein